MADCCGIVVAPHMLAAQVGAEVLSNGGNAFDAAVAVALAIGVTQPYHSGIGGGCNATFRTASGDIGHINARGPAPQKLTRTLFLDEQDSPDYGLATEGGLAMTIPSFVAGLWALHNGRGLLPWSDVCLAPQHLAADGFRADFILANAYKRAATAEKVARYGGSSPFAHPVTVGQLITQPQMAETLAAIAQDPQSVYTGEVARQVVETAQGFGGVLSADDLAGYRAEAKPVQELSYRGWRIHAPGLPTIGSLQAILALQILAHFDLSQWTPGSPQHLHLMAEAVRSTYAARAEIAGAEDSAKFMEPDFVTHFASQIRLDRIHPTFFLKDAANDSAISTESCTSHFCVADEEGNVVSQTQTIRSHFGAGIIDPATGIVLNDSVGDFSLRPGETTTQGIRYQGSYNIVAPKAEPASSQCPLIAVHPESGDMIAVGAAGGPRIVSATVQALVNQIDFGMDPRLAAIFPRVHSHGPTTDVDPNSNAAKALTTLGHQIKQMSPLGIMQTIRRRGGLWEGGADPNSPGGSVILDRSDISQAGNSTMTQRYGYTLDCHRWRQAPTA
ncbi:gamma-glutamyltransferase family protein [Chloroflexi bacterium TSY]|nr:gamma-glutamyltransferase family protein [Chloroflexi bacterium TSY]